MEAKARITWIGGRQFVGIDSGKHSVVISSQDEDNGTGMSPLELMLAALGGCTAMGVVDILEKKRQNVRRFEVNVSGELNQELPRVLHSIKVKYMVEGDGIAESAVAEAIQLSLDKYCSVSGTLKGYTEVVPSFQIINE